MRGCICVCEDVGRGDVEGVEGKEGVSAWTDDMICMYVYDDISAYPYVYPTEEENMQRLDIKRERNKGVLVGMGNPLWK
jgi:hypothetical protein